MDWHSSLPQLNLILFWVILNIKSSQFEGREPFFPFFVPIHVGIMERVILLEIVNFVDVQQNLNHHLLLAVTDLCPDRIF